MRSNELVSIIIPVYKVENYLDYCLASIVCQTYGNLEIILIDDGSPDNSPKLCDEWAGKDNRIKVIHKANGGVSSARNAGLKVAKGKYVYFCDSDDYIANDMIEKLVSGIGDSQLAVCGYNIVKDNKILRKDFTQLKDLDVESIIKDIIHGWDFGLLWNKLYVRELITEQFDENFKIREDLYFNTYYFRNVKKISIVEDKLYNYVKRERSLTSSLKKIDSKQLFLVHKLMIEVIKEKGFEELVPHQNAVFLKGFINLLKPFTVSKFSKADKAEFLTLLSNEVVKNAFKNYQAVGVKEKIFLFLLKKKQIKLLITLIKFAR